jgi:hypothetical protein
LDYPYTDWILDFQRRYQLNPTYRSLVTNYLENQRIKNQDEEERFFHLLQFLSFIKNVELNPRKDCKKQRIKKQNYYVLKFALSQFVEFTGIRTLKDSQRKKLILYFKSLQKLDPIVKEFSNGAFRSYVCFPYVECHNSSGNSWGIEVLTAEELFYFPYPFQLPESFLRSVSKNDLRLQVRLMKSLAVSERDKKLDLEEFFKPINVQNAKISCLIQKTTYHSITWNTVIETLPYVLESDSKSDKMLFDMYTQNFIAMKKEKELRNCPKTIPGLVKKMGSGQTSTINKAPEYILFEAQKKFT